MIAVGGDVMDSNKLFVWISFIVFASIMVCVVSFAIKDDESIKKVDEKLQVCEERLNQECPKCVDCESCFFESIEPNIFFHHIVHK